VALGVGEVGSISPVGHSLQPRPPIQLAALAARRLPPGRGRL
jgi:hypothetical protein